MEHVISRNSLWKRNVYHKLLFHKLQGLLHVHHIYHLLEHHTWSPQGRILQCVYRSCLLCLGVSLGMLCCQCNSGFFLLSNCVLLRRSIHQDKTVGTDTASNMVHDLNVHYINALVLCPRLQLCLIHFILQIEKKFTFLSYYSCYPITVSINIILLV